jgi:hypothetical protein
MAARQLPEDSAMRIPAGSRIVMQVHYNTIGGPVVPDRTSVVLQVRTTPPRFLFRTAPVAQPDLDIRAHDPASTHAITLRNWSSRPAEIASAAHHMHMLGDAIRAEIGRSDGGEECLLDIPRWDFQWQMQYQLPEDAHAFVQPGDSLTLECRYDNSAANQPSVNGVQQPPRDVTWGEGTFDEMCLMYLGILTPWTGAPAAATAGCAGAKACFDACPTKDASCLLGCEGAGAACLTCAAQGLLGCGAARCALQLRAISDCVVPCALSTNVFGGAIGACLEGTCGEAWRALTSCLDPHVGSPACEAALAGCGL